MVRVDGAVVQGGAKDALAVEGFVSAGLVWSFHAAEPCDGSDKDPVFLAFTFDNGFAHSHRRLRIFDRYGALPGLCWNAMLWLKKLRSGERRGVGLVEFQTIGFVQRT